MFTCQIWEILFQNAWQISITVNESFHNLITLVNVYYCDEMLICWINLIKKYYFSRLSSDLCQNLLKSENYVMRFDGKVWMKR